MVRAPPSGTTILIIERDENLAGGSTHEFHQCYIRSDMMGVGVGHGSMRRGVRAHLTLLAALILTIYVLRVSNSNDP